MTYAQFIAKLRVELKDFGKLRRDRWDGDGTTTLFQASTVPIKAGSYVVKISDVTQTEVTNYTLDPDTGVLEFTSAPAAGSDNVEMTYQSLNIRDEDYVELINDGIDRYRWKFWKEAMDTSTFTTVLDQYEYDLSSLTGILYVRNCYYKTSSSSTIWLSISGLTNWIYYPRQTKLGVNPPFSSSSLPMKFVYLKSLTKGTTTSATIDIPDEWILPFKYYVYARYYERIIPEKIHDTSAVTTQPTFAPAQVVYDISRRYYDMADKVAEKIAPKLPPFAIRNQLEGVIQ